MPFIKAKHADIYYEDVGVGEPVIFLHSSFSRGIISFSAQISDFQWHHRCIYPDFRGHGRSKSYDESWTTPELAEDVITVMDHLEIEKSHVIGHSLGGDVSYYCAIQYPERIKSVTAIGSTGTINETVLESANAYEPERIIEGDYENWINVVKANHYGSNEGEWIPFVKKTISNWRNYPNFTEEQLKLISVPFMLLYGSEDGTVKEEEIEKLDSFINNFKAIRIEGCGHRPHMTEGRPSEVNKIMLEFLRSG